MTSERENGGLGAKAGGFSVSHASRKDRTKTM